MICIPFHFLIDASKPRVLRDFSDRWKGLSEEQRSIWWKNFIPQYKKYNDYLDSIKPEVKPLA